MQQVAIYIRVSTDEQAEEGYSLDEQRRVCEAYAVSRGWNTAKIYADEGLSAFKDRIEDRPALAQLLRDVRTKRYHAIIVHKLDRFFRRVKLLISTVEDLEQQRCAFISVSEQIDFTTPAGRMMLANLGSFAEYYSRNLSAETAKGLRGKARKGDWVGPVPYGYTRHDKSLQPNNDAPVVQLIFQLYASGAHSYTSIADVLNEQGYTTFDWQSGQRGMWGRENVRGILRNPAYVGMVRCKEVLAPGNHPALVDQSTWDRCHEIIQRRSIKPGVTPVASQVRPGRMLSGLAYCAVCDAPMWLHTSKRNDYYRCAGRDHRTCSVGFVRCDIVEAIAYDQIRALVLPSSWRDAILKEAERLSQPAVAPASIDPAIIQRQLERLALVYASGDITPETYAAERTRLKNRLVEASAPRSATAWNAEVAKAMLDQFAELLTTATPEERRALVREVFDRVWIEPHAIKAQRPTESFQPVVATIAKSMVGNMGCPMGLSTPLSPYWLAHGIPWAA